MLKPSENPPIIYPDVASLEEIQGQWWVAHTKSRNEKVFAWNLMNQGIPYLLPMSEKLTSKNKRAYKSFLPLFSGYVFFCGDWDHRHQALATNRIAQVIEVKDQPKLVTELSAVYSALKSGLQIDPHPYLKKGTRCRVIAGALMGVEGIVVRRKNITRILLQVDMLGQSAAVEIASDLLEAL